MKTESQTQINIIKNDIGNAKVVQKTEFDNLKVVCGNQKVEFDNLKAVCGNQKVDVDNLKLSSDIHKNNIVGIKD